ncbi:MAG TPA: type II toxin-antitoxin system HicB family antitoxin [Caulobacteraceae bacterium]|jgi:predicted RNase H-like HicB family nuclease|nr:type II toxin-antitoxin system HicB family antitoxin [Caulobacteraceae bacterium]
MAQRFYPAVLERGEHGVYGVWFPDFPGVVTGARSQEEAMGKAGEALAQGAEDMAFEGRTLPEPTGLDKIALPEECEFVAVFSVGVEPPDQSERVNVYLPKSLIARVDRRAAEIGMSRSSFFGLAITRALRAGGEVVFTAIEDLAGKRGK